MRPKLAALAATYGYPTTTMTLTDPYSRERRTWAEPDPIEDQTRFSEKERLTRLREINQIQKHQQTCKKNKLKRKKSKK